MSDLQFKHSGSNSRSNSLNYSRCVSFTAEKKKLFKRGEMFYLKLLENFTSESHRSSFSLSPQRNGPDGHALPHGVPALRLHGLRHQQHRTHPAAAHHPRLRLRDILHTVRYRGHVRLHLPPPARRVLLINLSRIYFLCAGTSRKTHRTWITLLWNNSCLQAFISCHGLFPYFPITPPRVVVVVVVVAAKQPGRQNPQLWGECVEWKTLWKTNMFSRRRKQRLAQDIYAKTEWDKCCFLWGGLCPAALRGLWAVIKRGLSSAALQSLPASL